MLIIIETIIRVKWMVVNVINRFQYRFNSIDIAFIKRDNSTIGMVNDDVNYLTM
ncbi:hypothetical protein [Weissella fangxianensis]|uniref:hypothetical protein n=1 Tax=Weissella fangxianensis TaxID=2953879 RepID=UPI002158580C|nr:hypothetical protein [Weissella fangxianensis]